MSTLLEDIRREYVPSYEVRRILGISQMTFWRWVKQGKLKRYDLWQAQLFKREDVERLRREREPTLDSGDGTSFSDGT